jgi:acyl-coenzyme A synthetase/AMP-(fatty) acid ligase
MSLDATDLREEQVGLAGEAQELQTFTQLEQAELAAEVEDVLERHPGLAEVTVAGKEDAEYGQVLVAYVVPAAGSGIAEEEVVAFARERLAAYKVPKAVAFVERLPRNAVGKVVRRQLQ